MDKMINEYWSKYSSGSKEWIEKKSVFDILFSGSLFSEEKIHFMIDNEIDDILYSVLNSKVEFDFTVSNFSTGRIETIKNKNISIDSYKSFIKAAISGNIAFPNVVINGMEYGDGEVLGDYGIYNTLKNKKGNVLVVSNYCSSFKNDFKEKELSFFEKIFNGTKLLNNVSMIVNMYIHKHLDFELKISFEGFDRRLNLISPGHHSYTSKCNPFSKKDSSLYSKMIQEGILSAKEILN